MQRIRDLLELVYPRACMLCARLLLDREHRAMCPGCLEKLPPIVDGCRKCGAPRAPTQEPQPRQRKNIASTCTFCRNKRWACSRIFAFTVYSGLSVRVARQMKEPNYEPLTHQIGDTVGNWLRLQVGFAPEHYDFVIPIPQYWFRRLTHRYNQSEVLARRIGLAIDQRVQESWLRRARWTQKQGMKTISERIANMQDAFECAPRKALQGRRVLLVDDVMTSGATLDQAARALRQSGALHVDAAVFARGVGATRRDEPSTKGRLAKTAAPKGSHSP